MALTNRDYTAVIGIDFGTGGFAIGVGYCRNQAKSSVAIIEHKTAAGTVQKNSVSVLTRGNDDDSDTMSLVKLGVDAEMTYADMPDDETKRLHCLFQSVKMALYDQHGSTPIVTSIDGRRTVAAADIIALSLTEIYRIAIGRLKSSSGAKADLSVLWIMTVPAIWPDSAKQIMRQAACVAGIPDAHLKLAMEPEVASLSCRHESEFHADFVPNHMYMVVDAGTGTVDISVHQVDDDGRLRDVVAPTGLPFGARVIDRAFVALLKRCFTAEMVSDFRAMHPSDWIAVMANFEMVKCRNDLFAMDDDRLMKVSLGEHFAFMAGFDGDDDDDRAGDLPDGIEFDARFALLKLPVGVVRRLFVEPINQIVDSVYATLRRPETVGLCKVIYVVGGFGGCPMLLRALEDAIRGQNIELRSPIDPAMSVVRGAVLYGLYPELISSHISQTTIGVAVSVPADVDDNDDDDRDVLIANGIEYFTDALDVLVRAGDRIRPGKCIERSFWPVSQDQAVSVVRIYRSAQRDVTTIGGHDVKQVGELVIRLPEPQEGRSLEVCLRLTCGATEMQATAHSMANGLPVECAINFCGSDWMLNDAVRSGFVTVDVCFVMDCTGSMQMWIDAAKSQVMEMAANIRKALSRRDGQCLLRFAFVAYRDFCDGAHIDAVDFTSDFDRVKTFITNQVANGGGDHPEDLLGGLDRANTLKWNAKNRFVILTADAPCHGTEYSGMNSGDDYPSGNPDGLTPEVVLGRIAALNARLIFTRICLHTDRMMAKFRRLMPSLVEIDLGTNTDCITQFGESLTSEIVGHIQTR